MTRRDVALVTTLWGEAHRQTYVQAALPSLLAEGNIPWLAAHHDARLMIYTTSVDAEALQDDPAFRAAAVLIPIDIVPIDRWDLTDAIVAHQRIWVSAAKSLAPDQPMFLLPPDSVWSSHTLMHIMQLAEHGARWVFVPHQLRVVQETFVPDLLSSRGNAVAACMSGSELTRTCLRHLHPWSAAQSVRSRFFTRHPEVILWEVKGEGVVAHSTSAHPVMITPSDLADGDSPFRRLEQNLQQVDAVCDSDQAMHASLAPLGKDQHWYDTPRHADPQEIGRWWLEFESSACDQIALRTCRMHIDTTLSLRWGRIERATRGFVWRCLVAREALHAWRAALDCFCFDAARAIAVVLERGLLWRGLAGIPPDSHIVVLLFRDGEFGVGDEPKQHPELFFQDILNRQVAWFARPDAHEATLLSGEQLCLERAGQAVRVGAKSYRRVACRSKRIEVLLPT